jgi:hypothetical protein
MIKLYLDIDGVLLTAKKTRPAKNVASFIQFVTNNFECYWLTTHCKGDSKTALKYLAQYLDSKTIDKLENVKSTYWTTLKTEAIDFTDDFFWLDDNPLQVEISIVDSAKRSDRLIIVNLDNHNELKRVKKHLYSSISCVHSGLFKFLKRFHKLSS